MKIFKIEDYVNLKNPTPGELYRADILTVDRKAKDLIGFFGLLSPGNDVPYHIHRERESIFIPISGEVTMIFEGKEMSIKPGVVVYMPPGKKHGLVNKTDEEVRYLEFCTYPPFESDFEKVE